jgi:hypothetical protein
MKNAESPFETTQLLGPDDILLKQVLVTYRKIRGKVYMTTVERTFSEDDYDDSETTEILD